MTTQYFQFESLLLFELTRMHLSKDISQHCAINIFELLEFIVGTADMSEIYVQVEYILWY